MSILSERVAQAVCDLGEATLDDISRYFPGYRRDQLQKALSNAKCRGLIRVVRRGLGGPGRRHPAIFGDPAAVANDPPPKPCASVWEWGARA